MAEQGEHKGRGRAVEPLDIRRVVRVVVSPEQRGPRSSLCCAKTGHHIQSHFKALCGGKLEEPHSFFDVALDALAIVEHGT